VEELPTSILRVHVIQKQKKSKYSSLAVTDCHTHTKHVEFWVLKIEFINYKLQLQELKRDIFSEEKAPTICPGGEKKNFI